MTLGAGDRDVVLRPRGGEPVDGVLVGRSATVFVLSNESDENLCSWLPFVAELRPHGYGALLYDSVDPSQLPADSIAGARAALSGGARHAVLMGASVGARASIEAAASHPPGVSAVVALSAERTVRSDPTDLTGPARKDRVPALVVGARQDPFVEGFTSVLFHALGSRDKRALIVPGMDHGTDLWLPQPSQRCGRRISRL